MDAFIDATNVDSSADGYANASKTLAFKVGEQAAKAGDEETRSALTVMSSATAALADGLIARGSVSTTEELAFRSAITSVTELCNLPGYTFQE